METLDVDGFVHNNSFYDYELHNEGPMSEDPRIEIFIILSIVILLSLIGNTLVVVISVFCMRLQSLTIIFILNLALSDLLFTVGLVLNVYDHIWGLTHRNAACKAIESILATGFCSNLVFLMLMSVQRYMAVVHPLSGWKKGRCFTLVLICAWVGSILAALPVMVHIVAHPDARYCAYSSITAQVALMYEQIIGFSCAFLVIGFCYIRILQTIFKSPTNQTQRITGLAFFLVAIFFICWAPFNIMMFLGILIYHQTEISFHDFKHFYYAMGICQFLALTRCCLNPIIYGLFGVKFRTTPREILQRRAIFNSAQIRMVELHSAGCVNLNNKVPELDEYF